MEVKIARRSILERPLKSTEPKKYNAKNDATLQSWLDLSSQLRLDIIEQRTVGQQLVRQQVSRRDPKCRFM